MNLNWVYMYMLQQRQHLMTRFHAILQCLYDTDVLSLSSIYIFNELKFFLSY